MRGGRIQCKGCVLHLSYTGEAITKQLCLCMYGCRRLRLPAESGLTPPLLQEYCGCGASTGCCYRPTLSPLPLHIATLPATLLLPSRVVASASLQRPPLCCAACIGPPEVLLVLPTWPRMPSHDARWLFSRSA